MTIIDMNGKSIEVKNLDDAIGIAAQYKEYKHKDKTFKKIDQERNLYWADLYEKLLQLKEKTGQ